jgi:hypothetical protein
MRKQNGESAKPYIFRKKNPRAKAGEKARPEGRGVSASGYAASRWASSWVQADASDAISALENMASGSRIISTRRGTVAMKASFSIGLA